MLSCATVTASLRNTCRPPRKGDVRLFVMNGRPLARDGKYAAFRRINKTGDARSNMHSGGESEPVEVTDEMLRLVQVVRPKLMSDGMFLVGLDIVADKLIEVNVFSPGGIGSSSEFAGVDFARVIIEDLAAEGRVPQILQRPDEKRRAGDVVAGHSCAVAASTGSARVAVVGLLTAHGVCLLLWLRLRQPRILDQPSHHFARIVRLGHQIELPLRGAWIAGHCHAMIQVVFAVQLDGRPPQ